MTTEQLEVTAHPTTQLREGLFERMVGRLHKDHPDLPPEMCERIQSQSLSFLGTCAANPGVSLTPSVMVDLGWHNFILHTEDYAGFCQAIAGRFIHHYPYDGGQDNPEVLARTQEMMIAAGFKVDHDLWKLNANCSDGTTPPCGSHAR